jgi:hypothetical protein
MNQVSGRLFITHHSKKAGQKKAGQIVEYAEDGSYTDPSAAQPQR